MLSNIHECLAMFNAGAKAGAVFYESFKRAPVSQVLPSVANTLGRCQCAQHAYLVLRNNRVRQQHDSGAVRLVWCTA